MSHLSGKKSVIAGGSGFLGIPMAGYLATAGAFVTLLSRSIPKATGRWSWRSKGVRVRRRKPERGSE